MKTYTKYPLLIAAFGLAIFSGCKKSKPTTDTNTNTGGNGGYVQTTTNTNTVTATASCDYDVSDTAFTNHGWTKAFDDGFNDLSNWGPVTGGVQKELELNQPANAQITNGNLTITAKKETVTGPKTVGNDTTQSFNYTSAWLISHNTFSANSATPKIRIVARLKTAGGYGLSSLFYAFGNGNWPVNGEIDMMENQGNGPKIYSVDYHYGTVPGKDLVTDGLMFNPTTEDLSACYHVYMMEWTQNSLKTYLDGNLVESANGTYVSALFGKPMYLSLSCPIGGLFYKNLDASSIQGGTMTVDYVKVFTSN